MLFTHHEVNSGPDMVTMTKKKEKNRLKILASQTNKVCKICLEVCTFIKKFVWAFVGQFIALQFKNIILKTSQLLDQREKSYFFSKTIPNLLKFRILIKPQIISKRFSTLIGSCLAEVINKELLNGSPLENAKKVVGKTSL